MDPETPVEQQTATPPESKPQQAPADAPKLADEYVIDEEPEPDIEPEPEPAPKAEKPNHPSYLLRMATDLGMSDDEVAGMDTERLGEVVHHLNAQIRKTDRENARAQAVETAKEPKPAPPVEDEDEWGTDPEGNKLSEKDYFPAVAKTIKTQKQHEKELKELREKLARFEQQEIVRQNETAAERIDREFSRHEKHLGKGRGREMDNNSSEFQRRVAVLSLVDRDKSKDQLGAKIDRAVKLLYGESEPEPEPRANGRISKEDWDAAAVVRPTKRRSEDDPPGRKKAERSVAKALKEAGNDGVPEADDFPE